MPTVGWIQEDAIERFWEGQQKATTAETKVHVFVCERCGREFFSPSELRRHFSLEHPLELPALYVHAIPLLRESIIRSPIKEKEVEFVQCSRCEVQVNGGGWQTLTLNQFCQQLTKPRNSTWNVRLIHERPLDGSRTEQEYHIRFRIPDTQRLNMVDEHFIRTLALDEVKHSDLKLFEAGLPAEAPTREYGGALGDYALGIILKERRNQIHSQMNFEEFAVKMRSALEVLRHFNRPVALAVSNSIRFNLNNFVDYSSSNVNELETALSFFRSIIKEPTVRSVSSVTPNPQRLFAPAVCPVDNVTSHLLVACARLSDDGKLSLSDLQFLRQLTRGMFPVSEQDLTKVHVICAEGYLRLGRTLDAILHLRAIQFDPPFSYWAQNFLEDLKTNGY